MEPLELGRVCEMSGGALHGGFAAARVLGVSTDTRRIEPGDLFFAIRGPRFDGHDFIREAASKGAVAAVVEREVDAPGGFGLVLVEDARAALGRLASRFRDRLRARVVAITGTNGKTTTKEMAAHVLGGFGRVARAQGSFNNDIGMPLTLLGADPSDDFAVLELGMNRPGEIDALGAICRPDIGVVTNVSEAHLEGVGTVEGVAAAKEELLAHVSPRGAVVLNQDNPWTARMARRARARVVTFGASAEADVRGEELRVSAEGIRFQVNGRIPCAVPVLGGWNMFNALAALAAARAAGIAVEDAAGRLADFKAPPMRMEPLLVGGVRFINDAYNANPRSVQFALDAFGAMEAPGRRVVVFGEMRELGTQSRTWHEKAGEWLAAAKPDLAVTVGCAAEVSAAVAARQGTETWSCATAEEAAARLNTFLGEGDLVLLKGSRAVGLEKIPASWRARTQAPDAFPPADRPERP